MKKKLIIEIECGSKNQETLADSVLASIGISINTFFSNSHKKNDISWWLTDEEVDKLYK
jgi:hypothetical protein